jgi:hypothetical protein
MLLPLGLAATLGARPAAMISFKQEADSVRVLAGDQAFAMLRFGPDRRKPILHPVFGPGQLRMTRNFPITRDTPGEKTDHPHHESLWYTHGKVNGVDFWSLGRRSGTIRQTGIELAGNTIRSTDDWLAPDGRRVCSDQRAIRFTVLPGGERMIDFTITLRASDGELVLGDTKEGSMGIRMHPSLRIDQGARAVNSAGDKGGSVWGKAAKWIDYRARIDGRAAGIAIFDHPGNPRHPTTWHARSYGLVAANPFGLSHFQKAGRGAGDMTIKDGDQVTFRYAFLFHHGEAGKQPIEAFYRAWASR